jgi:hypothetical protein
MYLFDTASGQASSEQAYLPLNILLATSVESPYHDT